MTALPPDPLDDGGIVAFGRRLRAGQTTIEAVTRAYLDRIAAVDRRLGAFEHVASAQALATSQALDGLLAAGTDLGPLMGVPVAIKDILAVNGMPVTAGSNIDVSDLIGAEGTFVQMLRRAGCIILGKVKTTEFALGTLMGINQVRGTPYNPWDPTIQRLPGSSSSGSGVAVAAGLCGFAVGSDTGGSVRLPAAYCGVFGLKTTKGVWPTDGVFPLSPTFDTLSILTRSASDAAIVFATLQGTDVPSVASPYGLRLGRPSSYFFDQLEPAVATCLEEATTRLADAGVEIVPFELPESDEAAATFDAVTTAELIASLGRERFARDRHRMDPVGEARARLGLDVMADEYIQRIWRQRELVGIAHRRMDGLDGWLAPGSPMLPMSVADAMTPDGARRLTEVAGRATRQTNLFGLCATCTPVQALGAPLPVSLQVNCHGGHELKALSIARLLEDLTGLPPRPDVTPFL